MARDAQDHALAVLPVLLKAGADVNARVTDTSSRTAIIARPSSMTNRQGQTALFGAINWGWSRVVKYLLDNGAHRHHGRRRQDDPGRDEGRRRWPRPSSLPRKWTS